MTRTLRIEFAGAYYHVMSRGNDQQAIFKDELDFRRFLGSLRDVTIRYSIKAHAYCLMQNHYHLILETPKGNLSKAMHTLNSSYATYFNTRHRRRGHLLQGRYKAILIQADEYLHHLSRYIHLNPIRAHLVHRPEDYPWSSYRYYATHNKKVNFPSTEFILKLFHEDTSRAKSLYKAFVEEATKQEIDIIKRRAISNTILGNKEFSVWLKRNISSENIRKEAIFVSQEAKLNHEQIERIIETKVKNEKLKRKLSIYLTRKYTDRKLKEIARLYHAKSEAMVCMIYQRIEQERHQDEMLNQRIGRLEGILLGSDPNNLDEKTQSVRVRP